MPFIISPDAETFSTPPTTPDPFGGHAPILPSLSRRNSRPTTLDIDRSKVNWTPGVVIDDPSPQNLKPINRTAPAQELVPPQPLPAQPPQQVPPTQDQSKFENDLRPMNSPCFVHSQLNKGASLTDWLRSKQHQVDVGIAKSLQHGQACSPRSANGTDSQIGSNDSDSDDDGVGSLTKQLAETAVGVREMSKQLGRARVRSNIQSVLIITKARDNRLIKLTRELALYLMLKPRNGHNRGLVVYVDRQLRHSRRFDADGIERDHPELFIPYVPRRRTSSNHSLSSLSSTSNTKDEFNLKDEGQLRYWTSDMCSHSPHLFDFVVTLGGDGTVLFTSWLFQRIVPPVLPFALGSLGFLTNFDFADHQAVMDSVIDSGIRVNLRMRFTCTVYRTVAKQEGKGRKAVKKGETGEIMMKNVEKGGWEALEGGWSGGYSMPEGGKSSKDKEIMCFTTRPVETFEVLNDLVVDRGPSPYVSLLELFGDEHHMTTVQADGLTVSTPTGSTAYSLSAGGSLVHPEIPALLITPICPHTLSFRPMLLPDSMELRICVPFNSRSTAWASFDGRGRVELKQGDHIKVTPSKYPFPTVCADKQSTDWFHAISRTLKWNERERQKSFVVVEEEHPRRQRRRKHSQSEPEPRTATPDMVEETLEDEEEDDVSDEEEEEDKFDIDDSSPEAASSNADKLQKETPAAGLSLDEPSPDREETLKRRSMLDAASASLSKGRRPTKSRSRSRSSGLRSGVETPGRFAGPHPHPPPHMSHRHVDFLSQSSSPTSSLSSDDSLTADAAQHGVRDDLFSPKAHASSGKSRIPKNKDLDLESVRTPTVASQIYERPAHHRVGSSDHHGGHRAFAVWGQDESDSNASDSDM